jgi:3-hydroxybutyryl-CoA dehydrogenase
MAAEHIVVVGAGRMGRGIAQAYAVAGGNVVLVDLKERDEPGFAELQAAVHSDIRADLEFMVGLGLLQEDRVREILERITTVSGKAGSKDMDKAVLVYEALPETLENKQQAFDWVNANIGRGAMVASTTSTLNVDELAAMVTDPGRFLNAHWLNPAHLMPLVEVAVGSATREEAYKAVHESLIGIGKVPVRCSASPGYIVPRIQALAMNEAARLVEEGVASAEDIDKAVRVGFGLRFAVLGLLEFIDWGGNDILYYASQHLSRTVDPNRYRAPDIIENNMHTARNGIREGRGFYEYAGVDIDAYRRERLGRFLDLVEYSGLLPKGLERK